MKIILGIDPGLRKTGWGVVGFRQGELKFMGAGTVRSDEKSPLWERLLDLSEGLKKVLADFSPDEAAIEETFVTRNGASTLKLGQARGALILTAAMAGIPVHEYAATLVKKTVVGVGRAEKDQVGMMIKHLLPGCAVDSEDAADALAVAICHSVHGDMARLLAQV